MSKAVSRQGHSIDGLLLPQADGNLLLPSVAVVELLGYPDAISPSTNSPDWCVGRFDWRGLSLPLISWERLTGQTGVAAGQRKRVAVCQVFSGDDKVSFAGLETCGLPRLVSVVEADMQARAGSAVPQSCILAEVRLRDSLAYIPDLDALGKLVASFSG